PRPGQDCAQRVDRARAQIEEREAVADGAVGEAHQLGELDAQEVALEASEEGRARAVAGETGQREVRDGGGGGASEHGVALVEAQGARSARTTGARRQLCGA